MVILRVTKSEIEFQFVTELARNVEYVVEIVSRIINEILKLQRIESILPDFIAHGPLRAEEHRGLTDTCPPEVVEKEREACEANHEAYEYNSDPSGFRTGQATTEHFRQILDNAKTAIENAISKKTLPTRQITLDELKEVEQNLKGSVTLAYPMGLPSYDPL
ncbi:MAG: hypothetical protein EZS28_033323, partial [Streblomastix strix]